MPPPDLLFALIAFLLLIALGAAILVEVVQQRGRTDARFRYA